MKLFWKLLAGMLGIMIAVFAVFGTALLQTSFQSAMNREKQSGLEEIHMLQYALLAAAEGLEETYNLNERTMGQLAESVVKNVGSGHGVCLYSAAGEGIYPSGAQAGGLYALLAGEQPAGEKNAASASRGQTGGGAEDAGGQTGDGGTGNCVWRFAQDGDCHVMEAMARLDCGGQTYYLKVERDIEYIYADREAERKNYRVTLLLLTAVAALLSALFAAGFTAPVRRLSLATRAFSRGDYGRRVKPRGNDEIAGLMRDFNRMAEELEKNILELEENARRQEEFTGAFAHELKTPLTAMIGYGEMLMSMELCGEDKRQAADYIYREGRRLERLSYKMMELIRVGRLGIEPGPVRTLELSRRLKELVAARVKEMDFSCNFEEAVIAGDLDLMLSLLTNLVDNACKASAAGGEIRVEGSRAGEPGGEPCYRIRVSDKGRGIPEDEVEHVTEAFYMVDKSRARREGGAGLGMAICEKIVEAHDARWEIASAPEEGTRVTIFFPLWKEGEP